jgi:NDP-hexose-3-ketoreductase
MSQLIKIGVLSTANIAVRSVIPAIIGLPNYFQFTGIASRTSEKLSVSFGSIEYKAYVGYEKLVNDQNIDAIYIALPNSLHAEWIEKSLLKGKHILVEKSLGCNLLEVEYLTKLAKSNNLILLENFQFRFHPQMLLLNDILVKGSIGEIRCLKASFGFPPFRDLENIRYKKNLGGGALLDAGAYTTKISQIILGFDLQVKAGVLNKIDKSEVDIWGGAFLQNPNTGAFAELAFGFDHFYQCGIEIWGSQGKLSTNRLFTAPSEFEPQVLIEKSDYKEVLTANAANHFELMLIHFYNLIKNNADVDIEHRQNVDQARLLEEIKKNAYEK